LDRFDGTIATYQLNYPINKERTTAASNPSNALGKFTASDSSAPPPTWIMAHHRNEYYRCSPLDNCCIYASGLFLNANFQPIAGSHGTKGQFAITNEEVV
jgi:hypothetical protein